VIIAFCIQQVDDAVNLARFISPFSSGPDSNSVWRKISVAGQSGTTTVTDGAALRSSEARAILVLSGRDRGLHLLSPVLQQLHPSDD
jgi:hypothetical protein